MSPMPRAFPSLLTALALAAGLGCVPAAAGSATERKAELVNLVRQDCGSCHGLTLKGGLGPPLVPEALAGKDRMALAYTILYGRPGTPMPPWKDFVSEAEAGWIVEQLLNGFPDGH